MRYHLIIYVPVIHANAVRDVLARCGAGKIGSYDSCSFSCRGTGRFRPLKGADPFLGKENVIEEVEEERIEVVIPDGVDLKKIVKELRTAHPYEEPAIHILPMIDGKELA